MDYGPSYLRRKLAEKKNRVDMRYRYYEMKNGVEDASALIPDGYRWLAHALGWCAKAVDSLADRIVFDGFADDPFRLGEIYRLNNADILPGSAVLSALISSCSFLYLRPSADGYPVIECIDGGSATGIIDPSTQLLTEGYAVLERDKHHRPTLEAYFQPGVTWYFRSGRLDETLTVRHPAPYPLLVPVVHRPDARRPFGHSRISRACISVMQSTLRTLRRSEISAEFYSIPQKYALGIEPNAKFDREKATYSSFLVLGRDRNGNAPQVGQFQQQSMTPFIEQMRMLASLFAAETGLTLDDLGFSTDNPSSYDAIRASHESLRLSARRAQQTFGTGLLNAGYLAACLRDEFAFDRKAFAQTEVLWEPLFEPDGAALGALGDAVLKLDQASEGFIGAENLRRLTGLRSDAG